MEIDKVWFILFCIFCTAVFLQLFYLLFFHLRVARHRNIKREADANLLPPLSVIICARNEDTNLKKNLPQIFAQKYPVFEVIVVDDNSDDGTTEYLYYLSQKEPRLKRVKVGQTNPMMAGKKFPLTLGLKAATYEHIILTDADCYPAGEMWLHNMASGYQAGREIVLGVGKYEVEAGFLNTIIRYETFTTAINYLSYGLAGMTYMGVGRNLSYMKHLFFDSGGFFEHRQIPSGDDDLFINKVARKRNTAVVMDPEAFTYSAPKESWPEWKEQKKRHLSTARYYRFGHKFLLGLQPLSHVFTWLCGICLLAVNYQYWYVVAGALFLRLILQRMIHSVAMNKLMDQSLKPYIELFDFLQMFYYFRFAKSALFKTKYRWN